MKRWLFLAMGCAVAAMDCMKGRAGSKGTIKSPRIEVQGHRGCRALRPENTIAGFRHAMELGADTLDLDLGMSKDGVLLVVHDPEINAAICTGGEKLPSRLFRELSYEQVRTLDCGSTLNPRYPHQVAVPGEKIPRLEQVLDLLEGQNSLRLNIEIKTFEDKPEKTHPPVRFAETLVKLLQQRRLQKRVIVQSFDPRALQAVARLDATIALAALVSRYEETARMLRLTGARVLSPRHSELSAKRVEQLHRQGLRVIPWTVNDQKRMRTLIAWGVDGIITDRPDLLMTELAQGTATKH